MVMFAPPHPGLSVKHDCLEPLGLTVTEGAKVLDVTRQALNRLSDKMTAGIEGVQRQWYQEGQISGDFRTKDYNRGKRGVEYKNFFPSPPTQV